MTIVQVECAWCRKSMGTKKFKEQANENALMVSHSICPSCYANVMGDMIRSYHQKRKPLGERRPFYLPAFEQA